MPKRTILAAVDIENKGTAAGRKWLDAVCDAASFLAKRLKTGVELLYVEDMKAYHGKRDPAGIRSWRFDHETQLKLLSRQFEMPVSPVIKRGSPAAEILKTVRSDAAELVAMGSHGRKGMQRFLVGSVAEEIIRHCRRPVMVVGPMVLKKGVDLSGQGELQILVATDLGKNSRAAERYALSLGKRTGAKVVLFHCLWDSINAMLVSSAFSTIPTYDLDQLIAETRDDAVDALKQKSGYFARQGVRCEYKIQEKSVFSSCAVYQEGEGGYSMLVMGTRGRNAMLTAFFGSTARETILNASIPVIIVHSGK